MYFQKNPTFNRTRNLDHVFIGPQIQAITSANKILRTLDVEEYFLTQSTDHYGIVVDVRKRRPSGTAGTDSVNGLGFNAYAGGSTSTTQIAQGMFGFAWIESSNNVYAMVGAAFGIATNSGASGAIINSAVAGQIRSVRNSATPVSPLTKGLYVEDFSAWGGAGQEIYEIQIDTMNASTAGTRVAIQYGDVGASLWKIDEAGGMFMTQRAAPAAIATMAGIYVDTGGAGGRQRLMCLFESGAAQVLATEP